MNAVSNMLHGDLEDHGIYWLPHLRIRHDVNIVYAIHGQTRRTEAGYTPYVHLYSREYVRFLSILSHKSDLRTLFRRRAR